MHRCLEPAAGLAVPGPSHMRGNLAGGWLARLGQVLLVALAAGCGNSPPADLSLQSEMMQSEAPIDQVARTLDRLQRAEDFQPGYMAVQLKSDLDFWVARQTQGSWQAPSLIRRVSKRLQPLVEAERLGLLEIDPADIDHLKEAAWLADVARNVARRVQQSGSEGSWLKPQLEKLSADSAHELLLAEQLFDWVVRNIQLDELRPYPKGEMAGPLVPGANRSEEEPEPGPGYTYAPWQVLLVGHGDALERARLFALLCRQQGLLAVQLALDIDDGSGRLRPWCTGVVIGGELYLFDSSLGLPLPAAQAGEIATLAQVVAAPELLRQLDADDLKYAVKADSLKTIVALIEASPAALSLRMKLLQEQLPARFRSSLAISPDAEAEQLRPLAGIRDVRLAAPPLEAYFYRQRVLAARQSTLQGEEAVFEYIPDFMKARLSHLRGEYEGQKESLGAIAGYLALRMPDDVIERIVSSREIQRQLRLPDLPQNASLRRKTLEQFRDWARSNKRNASYWMGIVQWEKGEYEVAQDWLANRTLAADPAGAWRHGARYNLGRTYEALGDTQQAAAWYRQAEWPQRLGDLVRARRLETAGKTTAP